MPTAIVTHKDCILHDTGMHHPESKERLIAINKTLKEFKSKKIKWFKGEKIESKYFFTVHSKNYFKYIKNKSPKEDFFKIDADTILSKYSLEAAFKATGSACKAVDIINTGKPDYMETTEWEVHSSRNIEWLRTIVNADFWTDEDMTAVHLIID